MKKLRKAAITLLSVALVSTLLMPTISFAAPDNAQTNASAEATSTESQTTGGESEAPTNTEAAVANCTATIRYYEAVTYEEPGVTPDEANRYLLGTRTINNLSEGDVLDAWDYVVDLKGYFFFDGSPRTVVVSTDPDKNVIELVYVRYWNHSYTVNYYLMTGADLTASNWNGALQPEDVQFTKFATETIENQPFGALITADTHKHQIDGTYLVDAYPSEIRVGTDENNNTINVLYVPSYLNLPDDFEIVETPVPGDSNTGSDGSGDDMTGEIPNGPGSGSNNESGSTVVVVPGTQNPITSAPSQVIVEGNTADLPDDLTMEEVLAKFQEYIDAQSDEKVEITDDLPKVDPNVAMQLIAAYNTGLNEGKASCTTTTCNHIPCIIIMIILAILMILFLVLYLRQRSISKNLQGELDKLKEDSMAS